MQQNNFHSQNNQTEQHKTQLNSTVQKIIRTFKPGPNNVMNAFPYMSRLLDVIQNKNARIGVILGAGVSVSAGFGAFRSDNELFKQIELQYGDWPGRNPEQPDSFLEYALSFRSLMNDPRVLFRVLHIFQKITEEQKGQQPSNNQQTALTNEQLRQENCKKLYGGTLTHRFLRLLADNGQLRRVITQNVDGLEEQVGLRKRLKGDLLQIHGSFGGSPSCVNPKCPLLLLMRELKTTQYNSEIQVKQNIKQLLSQTHENFIGSVLSNKVGNYQYSQEKMLQYDCPRFDSGIHQWAVEDNAVPVCEACGCALKPGVVLYDEEVNLPIEAQEQMFNTMTDLLVIGTSLSVEPVSLLPPQLPPTASIHFIAKDLDLLRYLSDQTNGVDNYQLLISRRPIQRQEIQSNIRTPVNDYEYTINEAIRRIISKNIATYDRIIAPPINTKIVHGKVIQKIINQQQLNTKDENKSNLPVELQEDIDFKFTRKTIDQGNMLVEKYINDASQLLTFHKGECDVLFRQILNECPDLYLQYNQLQQQLEAEYVNQLTYPNYKLVHEENTLYCVIEKHTTNNNIEQCKQKVLLVLVAIPQLWTPDMALYWIPNKNKYAAALFCLESQFRLLTNIFAGNVIFDTFEFNGAMCKYIQSMGYNNDEYLDKAIYLPPGGHWAVYCISYNAYMFSQSKENYDQVRDPWSLNFLGYQQKKLYYQNSRISDGEFQYVGVWRSFLWALDNMEDLVIYRKNTVQVFSGNEYELFIYPVNDNFYK